MALFLSGDYTKGVLQAGSAVVSRMANSDDDPYAELGAGIAGHLPDGVVAIYRAWLTDQTEVDTALIAWLKTAYDSTG
jgi:hypothetical protein